MVDVASFIFSFQLSLSLTSTLTSSPLFVTFHLSLIVSHLIPGSFFYLVSLPHFLISPPSLSFSSHLILSSLCLRQSLFSSLSLILLHLTPSPLLPHTLPHSSPPSFSLHLTSSPLLPQSHLVSLPLPFHPPPSAPPLAPPPTCMLHKQPLQQAKLLVEYLDALLQLLILVPQLRHPRHHLLHLELCLEAGLLDGLVVTVAAPVVEGEGGEEVRG